MWMITTVALPPQVGMAFFGLQREEALTTTRWKLDKGDKIYQPHF